MSPKSILVIMIVTIVLLSGCSSLVNTGQNTSTSTPTIMSGTGEQNVETTQTSIGGSTDESTETETQRTMTVKAAGEGTSNYRVYVPGSIELGPETEKTDQIVNDTSIYAEGITGDNAKDVYLLGADLSPGVVVNDGDVALEIYLNGKLTDTIQPGENTDDYGTVGPTESTEPSITEKEASNTTTKRNSESDTRKTTDLNSNMFEDGLDDTGLEVLDAKSVILKNGTPAYQIQVINTQPYNYTYSLQSEFKNESRTNGTLYEEEKYIKDLQPLATKNITIPNKGPSQVIVDSATVEWDELSKEYISGYADLSVKGNEWRSTIQSNQTTTTANGDISITHNYSSSIGNETEVMVYIENSGSSEQVVDLHFTYLSKGKEVKTTTSEFSVRAGNANKVYIPVESSIESNGMPISFSPQLITGYNLEVNSTEIY